MTKGKTRPTGGGSRRHSLNTPHHLLTEPFKSRSAWRPGAGHSRGVQTTRGLLEQLSLALYAGYNDVLSELLGP